MGFFTPLRMVALFFIGVALGIVAADIVDFVQTGGWAQTLLGEAWAKLHIKSLNGFQVIIQREEYLNAPWIWDTLVTPVLLSPLWIGPLLIGIVLLLIKQLFFRTP